MRRREIKIGNYWTFGEWGCLLEKGWKLTAAQPNIKSIVVPGADGSLDYTEALTGDVTYADRTFTGPLIFPFPTQNQPDHRLWQAIHADITAKINGKRLPLVLPNDTEHFLIGRFALGDYDDSGQAVILPVTATLDPWRYALRERVITLSNLTGTQTVKLYNGETKRVIPILTTSQPVKVSLGGKVVNYQQGIFTMSDFPLFLGETDLVITASVASNLTISYREAHL